jgi:peptidyl-prolyl cis-trans isomerase-like 4
MHTALKQSLFFQFFITLNKDIDHLNNKHTVFGEVAEGFEVLQKFNEAYVDKDGRPYQDIR